eukprot:1761525-Rhodomonas_salina.6
MSESAEEQMLEKGKREQTGEDETDEAASNLDGEAFEVVNCPVQKRMLWSNLSADQPNFNRPATGGVHPAGAEETGCEEAAGGQPVQLTSSHSILAQAQAQAELFATLQALPLQHPAFGDCSRTGNDWVPSQAPAITAENITDYVSEQVKKNRAVELWSSWGVEDLRLVVELQDGPSLLCPGPLPDCYQGHVDRSLQAIYLTISPCLLAFKSPTSRLFILTNNPSQVFWTSRRCLSLLALYGIRRKSCTYCLRDCLTFLSIELVDPGSSLRVVDYEGQRAGQFGPGKSTYLSEVFSMLLWAGMSSSQIGMWILDNVLSAGPGPSAL